ncbi:GNAT family N-acetyltransferase [Isoptericola aurantiacus]|uniref:GNAT family N-acetyltransferase n=1 Tax=Isoptericola aurantiacus TaxID=3377839 RepID=UPI00383A116E
MEPFVLRSARVTLSAPTTADIDRIAAACADPAVAEWTTVPAPYTRSDAEQFVTGFVPRGWADGTDHTWAVRPAGQVDGPVLGMMGVSCAPSVPGAERAGEIGYWTAPEARGQGLTTAAGRLVADWALDPDGLGLVRLQWLAFVGNWGSRRVAWKLGFRFEGTMRRHGSQRGVLRDDWVGSLLPGDPREPSEPWPAEAPAP